MSIGDLFHPPESWDPNIQVAILEGSATRWYAAHLLLFIGTLVFIPGILELTRLGASRNPRSAYGARILMVMSVGALSAVFVFEMLLGRFVSEIADHALAVALLETFQSAPVFAVLLPALLAFFGGTALFVFSLAPLAAPLRWPAFALSLGAVLIFGEIVLAQVLLSQIGNILIFLAGIGFARVLLRAHGDVPAI
jgi:hypothetical protein